MDPPVWYIPRLELGYISRDIESAYLGSRIFGETAITICATFSFLVMGYRLTQHNESVSALCDM